VLHLKAKVIGLHFCGTGWVLKWHAFHEGGKLMARMTIDSVSDCDLDLGKTLTRMNNR
jgi:hypothetical protein